MRNALAAVELVETFLDCREKFHPVCDLIEGCVIGKFVDGVEHEFLLCHGQSIAGWRLRGKCEMNAHPQVR